MDNVLVSTISQNTSTAKQPQLVGWVDESPGRGTLSVIATCLFTTFLCTWAVIHPRVSQRQRDRLLHKFALCIKTIIAPEFIAVEGVQEWSQARQMVRDCEEITNGGLDMVHAFYVGMLALRYRTAEGEKVIWPNQLCWLLEQRLLLWEEHASWGLSREIIRDKSNANTTVKLFALLQVSWFVAQSIMRTAHDLPLSQLETMTLSYVPLFAVTYFFWWLKPKDVLTPSVIVLPEMTQNQKEMFQHMSIDSAFDGEDQRNKTSFSVALKLTPRVFEWQARNKDLVEERSKELIPAPARDEESKISLEKIEAQDKVVQQSSTEDELTPAPKQSPDGIRFDIQPVPLRSRHTAVAEPIKRTPTWTASARRAKTIQVTEDASVVQHIEASLTGRVLRRATTGYWTAQSTFGTHASEKKNRILTIAPKEKVVAYWDPHLYHSRIWPLTCLFGISFGALHLLSWNTAFPTVVESWLWRAAAITSIVSMLIFMQYEKVVLKWGGPLTLLSIISPAVYLLSRVVMIAGVIASFRAMDRHVYDTYQVSTYWVHLV